MVTCVIVSGKSDTTISAIYSADLGNWHTDLNLAAIYLGAPDADTSYLQTVWAAARRPGRPSPASPGWRRDFSRSGLCDKVIATKLT